MKTYRFHGNPNGNLAGAQGDQGFDVDQTPNNIYVCNGGTVWFWVNSTNTASGPWAGLAPAPTVTSTNWVAPNSASLAKVLSALVLSKSNENIDADSLAAALADPEKRRTYDPTLDDRMTELVNLVVKQFRGAIQRAGRYPLSVTPGTVPPECEKSVLNMAAFELINSTPTLQMVIITEKGASQPYATFYREAKEELEALTKGRMVVPPTDPTGKDYTNPINVPWVSPFPPFNPALPVNFNWPGPLPSPYGTYNPANPINVPWGCSFPVFNPAMPINKPIESIRVGASGQRTNMNTSNGWGEFPASEAEFPVYEIGQP
jgi:hypothetical protein